MAAEGGDADRAVVVTRRVRSDDGHVDAARTPFEHSSEPVDDEVVADVVPTQGLGVVVVDAAENGRDVLASVLVTRGRVVDHRQPGGVGVVGLAVPPRLVRAPVSPGDDRWLERCRLSSCGFAEQCFEPGLRRADQTGSRQTRGVDQVRSDSVGTHTPDLQPPRLAHPHRLCHPLPAGSALARAGVRPLTVGRESPGERPRGPGPAVGGGSEVDGVTVRELESDEAEGHRGHSGRRQPGCPGQPVEHRGRDLRDGGPTQTRCDHTTTGHQSHHTEPPEH